MPTNLSDNCLFRDRHERLFILVCPGTSATAAVVANSDGYSLFSRCYHHNHRLSSVLFSAGWENLDLRPNRYAILEAMLLSLYALPAYGARHGEIVHKNFLHRHLPIEAYPVIKARPVQRLTLGEAKHQCWGTGPSKASSPKLRPPRNRLLLSPASHASDHQS